MALLEEEGQRLGEHVAGELDGRAVLRRAAVAVGGGQHALAERVMGAADLHVGDGQSRHLVHQVAQLAPAFCVVRRHGFDARSVSEVVGLIGPVRAHVVHGAAGLVQSALQLGLSTAVALEAIGRVASNAVGKFGPEAADGGHVVHVGREDVVRVAQERLGHTNAPMQLVLWARSVTHDGLVRLLLRFRCGAAFRHRS